MSSRTATIHNASCWTSIGQMVNPATTVRDLGIYIDANLSVCTHELRQLWTVRRCLPLAAYKLVIM